MKNLILKYINILKRKCHVGINVLHSWHFCNIFRWQFFLERDTKMYFIDILWAQAYNNNTLLLAAIIYLKKTTTRAQLWKGKEVLFFKLPISNVNNLLPRSLEFSNFYPELSVLTLNPLDAFTIVPVVKMLILPLVTNGTIVSQRFHW